MDKKSKAEIQLFEGNGIRHEWDSKAQKWYFSVVDVVRVLSDSKNPTDYLKKMRKRDEALGVYLGTNCPLVAMMTESGKRRKTLAGTAEDILRVIQSIPSPKAEPLKQWLAKAGAERIAEEEDPEIAIDRAKETYLRKGYTADWVNQRILGIRVRNELTDQWKEHGVRDSREFSALTSAVHRGTFGVTPKVHKEIKGLKSQNLRDNMTTLETVLTMLGEATTAELTKANNPSGFTENMQVAQQGGSIAGEARKGIERLTGKPVISPINAKNIIQGEDDTRSLATSVKKDVGK